MTSKQEQMWFLANRFMDRPLWHAVKHHAQTPKAPMVACCGVERVPGEVQTAQLDVGLEPLEVEGQQVCRECRKALA